MRASVRGVVLCGALALLVGCSSSLAANPTSPPTATALPPTATALPPTATALPPTATALPPTATALPPTATALPPTATALPPTATALPPTATALPPVAMYRYVFPVQSDEAHYGRDHHDYPATDIFCPIGSPFVAVTASVIDAVVREDVWNPQTNRGDERGGLAVALIGDDGVRYYGSHLSAIADGLETGMRVEAGQLLGLTGNSGNARDTPPHLHFGISRPTTPDDWQTRRGELSPYPYLRAWQRGESLTPTFSE